MLMLMLMNYLVPMPKTPRNATLSHMISNPSNATIPSMHMQTSSCNSTCNRRPKKTTLLSITQLHHPLLPARRFNKCIQMVLAVHSEVWVVL